MEREERKSEVKNQTFFGKLYEVFAGIFMGFFLIVIGSLLSLTVIGAFIGIPLILVGIGLPFGATFANFKSKKSVCPYCGNKIVIYNQKAINCSDCKKRLLVRDKKLVLVE